MNKKVEAIERMKMINLGDSIIDLFKNTEKVSCSRKQNDNSILVDMLSDEEIGLIESFEARRDALVYHVTSEKTEYGLLLDLFFVSRYESEWEYDRKLIANNCAYVYVCNINVPEFSEGGTIAFKNCEYGMMRTS